MLYPRNKVRQWIAEGEGPSLDFKQNITSEAKIAKSIVAFANSRGGKIVVGVGDKGKITGVVVEEEHYTLEIAASKYCVPPVLLEYEWLEAEKDRMVLVAYVEESDNKPHLALDKKGEPLLYVRVADACIEPTAIVKETLMRGDLNYLQRNRHYEQLKNDLLAYLQTHGSITPQQFADWRNVSLRSAHRSLIDFWFEGVISSSDNTVYTATVFRR